MSGKPSVRSLAAAVLLIPLLAGCGRNSPPNQAQPPPPPAVTIAPVVEKEIVEWEEFTGRTEAVETVEVRPRVSGHIDKVHFQSGQMVKRGDLLFTIDPRWHQAEYDRRQAEYEQARVRLQNAENEARRIEGLLGNKAISIEEAEGRQARHNEAKAGVLAAEAARNFAQLDLELTEIRAPIDGKVSRAIVTPGNFVSGMAGNATLLTTIVSVDPIYVYADLDENSLLRFQTEVLKAGSTSEIPVKLQIGEESAKPHNGKIESFDNRVDPGTGSILLRAVFPNPEGAIIPGLFARIQVPLSSPYEALLIEESAIGTDQAQKFVLTLSETNTVQYRAVKLGPIYEGKRVIRSGLKAGEQVVINGLAKVRPGMPVTPVPAAAEEKTQTASR